MQMPWCEMSHTKLINAHKTLVRLMLWDAEQEIGSLQQALKAARAENGTPLATNDVSTTKLPQSSDVDSFDFPHRDDYVNTQPLPMMMKVRTKTCDPPGSPP